MKYIDDFRDPAMAKALAQEISACVQPTRHYRLMEFCGGHTHTIHRYGLPHLLPPQIELIHGPGCPVCVLPIERIDQAIAIANQDKVILCSYGDILRVPGSKQQSLLQAKAQGADIRMVYSVDDALNIAKNHPNHEVVFFAIGFETTTPPTAYAIQYAQQLKLQNFSIFCNHVLTPAAMNHLLQSDDQNIAQLDGFIGPAHVSIVIGSQAYAAISETYKKPIVIAGFEPLDILHAILLLIQQINQEKYYVENQYTRAVTPTGQAYAQQLIAKTLTIRTQFAWRGLGNIPYSALAIHPDYAAFDAEKRFTLSTHPGKEHAQCDCGKILRGLKKPLDCKLFARVCTPEHPLGACMVSAEGACAAVYAYQGTFTQ